MANRYEENDRRRLTVQRNYDMNEERLRQLIREEAARANAQDANKGTARNFGMKLVKNGWNGILNVAKSLNTPSTGQRPRISQLPTRRRDMGIARNADLSHLKDPRMRYRDIRGRLYGGK